ncbi:MAG TPA: hypothetical protein VKP30_06855 [Polyangiaceae bacterium]|nr:hypothetical protein [Polyangiaceae bacterium]
MARKNAARDPLPVDASGGLSEATVIHTCILRLALAVEDSRTYWARFDPSIPSPKRAKVAFEQRWFGTHGMEWVRYLIASFGPRYNAFPNALKVLSQWSAMDLATCQVVCHWHLQLSDPLYRRFTGDYLLQRRGQKDATVSRDAVFLWLKSDFLDKWSEATCIQLAGKLLSAAREVGMVSRRDPRTLHLPRVTDHALAYLLYLLREIQFTGSLANNPYLRSVGLDEELLNRRARGLPGVALRNTAGTIDLEWTYPDLASWGREVVS